MSAALFSWDSEWLAPAKLNLFLHVVGRRDDGYHLLETVFQLIDYFDRIRFYPRRDARVGHREPIPGVGEDAELCVRAARLLQRESGASKGVEISIHKSIPMGGGLGGGSSDAATTLLALNHLWALGYSRAQLGQLARSLGADVPFFLYGTNAFARGIGDELQGLEIPAGWYVVLTPPVAVPTAGVFADQNLTRNSKTVTISSFSEGFGRNDLEPVVCRRYPIVAAQLTWLKQYGDARMSGSGACVFARFPTETQARSVLAKMPQGIQGFVAAGLPRHPLAGLGDV